MHRRPAPGRSRLHPPHRIGGRPADEDPPAPGTGTGGIRGRPLCRRAGRTGRRTGTADRRAAFCPALPPASRSTGCAGCTGSPPHRSAHRHGAGTGCPQAGGAGAGRRAGRRGCPAGAADRRSTGRARTATGRVTGPADPAHHCPERSARAGTAAGSTAAAQLHCGRKIPRSHCRPHPAGTALAVGERPCRHSRRHPDQQAEDPAGSLYPDELSGPHPAPRQHPPDADDRRAVRAGAHRGRKPAQPVRTDLGVIDHYNGTRRNVKTLSGGESFKASLALALGLSDEVQSAAGGIRLDTLFLDEGFGSLDEESLEQAMRVLAGLTEGDRLVGIISHVSALKDRIDRQVVVRKARTGGSTVELIV
ncbi:SbcC/MukB-like Walker B domain-containing protein [Faecalibacterium sp. 7]|uniref:SbcC/MukB-like Walker B domain-containing protein n=1 Tax=Faecalibacterium sp. 7 TaxID=3402017 RepID=UPI003C2C39FA